jgi:Zn-dependent M28 family amino/carboxypeptidase
MRLDTYLPMMANSDHYNFARHGIPALRVVAGFNRPESDIRYILTQGDTRDRVTPRQLQQGAQIAAMLVWRGLGAAEADFKSAQ